MPNRKSLISAMFLLQCAVSKVIHSRSHARSYLHVGSGLSRATLSAKRPLEPLSPGLKISPQSPHQFKESDLTFAKTDRRVGLPTAGGTYGMKKRLERRG